MLMTVINTTSKNRKENRDNINEKLLGFDNRYNSNKISINDKTSKVLLFGNGKINYDYEEPISLGGKVFDYQTN